MYKNEIYIYVTRFSSHPLSLSLSRSLSPCLVAGVLKGLSAVFTPRGAHSAFKKAPPSTSTKMYIYTYIDIEYLYIYIYSLLTCYLSLSLHIYRFSSHSLALSVSLLRGPLAHCTCRQIRESGSAG